MGKALLVIAVGVIAVIAMLSFAQQSQDCNAKGGTLVKSVSGFYECVRAIH